MSVPRNSENLQSSIDLQKYKDFVLFNIVFQIALSLIVAGVFWFFTSSYYYNTILPRPLPNGIINLDSRIYDIVQNTIFIILFLSILWFYVNTIFKSKNIFYKKFKFKHFLISLLIVPLGYFFTTIYTLSTGNFNISYLLYTIFYFYFSAVNFVNDLYEYFKTASLIKQ